MAVSRIALTRPEMASRVEDLLVRMGQAGQIRGQVTDDQLKGLLQQVSLRPWAKRSEVEGEERVYELCSSSGNRLGRKDRREAKQSVWEYRSES